MKIAIGVALAALGLIVALLLLRRDAAPTEAPSPVSPKLPVPAASPEPAPAPVLPTAASPVSARRTSDLARALRDGDEKAVRAIQKALHEELHPPLADADNGAILYQKAFDVAREKMGGLSLKGLDRAVYSAAITGKELTAEQRAALRDWFQKNGAAAEEVTALFREAGRKLHCRFSTHDTALANNMGYGVNFLQLAARVHQENGNADAAADIASAGLAMARATRSSPDLLSQMMGCAQQMATLDGLQWSLDAKTPRLAAAIDAADPAQVRDAYRMSLLGDLDSTVGSLLTWKSDPAAAPNEEMRAWARSPLALQDVASFVEAIDEFLKFGDRPYHEIREDLLALVRQRGEFAPWYASMSKRTISALPGLTRSIAKSEAKMSMAKAALDLERYRSENGSYPATLDALKLAPSPDPFTGRPFAYRKEGSGFALESPGADGKDAQVWRSRN